MQEMRPERMAKNAQHFKVEISHYAKSRTNSNIGSIKERI